MKTRRFSQTCAASFATAILALNLTATSPAAAASHTPGRAARPASVRMELGALLQRTVAGQHLSGVVLVQRGGSILLRQGYGWADSSRRDKNAPATTFPLPGLTPIFSIAAAERLVEQGKLSLQSPITRYLPGPTAWRAKSCFPPSSSRP